MAEARVVEDVLTLLKRLEAALASNSPSDIVGALTALDAQPVTLPVLTKTKCGVVVAKLQSHAHSDAASSATSLVKKWKKTAVDAGIASNNSANRTSSSSSSSSTTLSPAVVAAQAVATSASAPMAAAGGSPGSSGEDASSSTESVAASVSAGSSSSSGAGAGPTSPATAPAASSSYVPTGAASVPLPPARATPRTLLTNVLMKLVKEHVLSSAATASPRGSSGSDDAAPPPPSPQAALAQAADVAAAIEAALYSAYGYPDPAKPGADYAARFRSLAMGLPRNPPLAMNVLSGQMHVTDLVKMSSDELVSEESKKKAEEIRRHHQESMQLDWLQKNKSKLLAAAGISAGEGSLKCGRCRSNNTEYTQKQTRSADEPMTTFALCNDCGNRWRFC